MNKNLSFFSRLSFALQGLRTAWSGESSFRTHVIVAALVVMTGVILRPEPIWWALLALAIGIVIGAELFNTALELLADHVRPEFHEEIKAIKDVAAAAVLIATFTALVIAAAFAAETFLIAN
ncbi:MAG: diacylglycerol kinase [Gammaproteobacteria bacterium]|nr:diacylglycerol kinase [Gammaproteobacteria bacterium]